MTNLGAQVTVPELVARARADRADAVLVSQVVTQKDAHLRNTRELAAAFREAMGEPRPLLVVGGPRFDPAMAADLGVDKVFGRGTTPGEVASYLVARPRSPEEDRHDRPAEVGLTVTHRRYVPYAHAHYGGAWSTAPTRSACSATSPPRSRSAWTATRACSPATPRSASSAPVRAGDVLEATAEVVRVGRRSRELRCTARVVAGRSPSGAPRRPACSTSRSSR